MTVFTLDLKRDGLTKDLMREGRGFHSLMAVGWNEVEKECFADYG